MDPFLTSSSADAAEETRLQTLVRYGLLEHEHVRSFDRITKLAARRLGAERAMLAWVDRDHIWLRARHGIELDHRPRPIGSVTPLLTSQLLWAEDATAQADPALADLAHQLGARFLAIAPLSTYNGQRLGALVVADPQPHRLEAPQRRELEELAETLMKQIETRRLYHRLGRNEGFLTSRQRHRSRCSQPASRPPSAEAQPRLADRPRLLQRLGRRLEALRHQPSQQRLPAALVLFDLRQFRALNARLGYAAGDRVLEEVSRRFDTVRRQDETAARLDGNTFGWFLADLAEPEEAESRVAELRSSLTAPIRLGETSQRLDPTWILVWLDPTEHRFADDVLATAEASLQEAKETSDARETSDAKNAPVIESPAAEPPTPAKTQAADAWTVTSERSLGNDELSLRYRPIHDRTSGRLEGFEAHVRWRGRPPSAPL